MHNMMNEQNDFDDNTNLQLMDDNMNILNSPNTIVHESVNNNNNIHNNINDINVIKNNIQHIMKQNEKTEVVFSSQYFKKVF